MDLFRLAVQAIFAGVSEVFQDQELLRFVKARIRKEGPSKILGHSRVQAQGSQAGRVRQLAS